MADAVRFPNRTMYQDMQAGERAAGTEVLPDRFTVIDIIREAQDTMPDCGPDIFDSITKKGGSRSRVTENMPVWRKRLQNLLRA